MQNESMKRVEMTFLHLRVVMGTMNRNRKIEMIRALAGRQINGGMTIGMAISGKSGTAGMKRPGRLRTQLSISGKTRSPSSRTSSPKKSWVGC